MNFSIQFKGDTVFTEDVLYDEELDNVMSLLHDLCAFLERTDSVELFVSGFGQERWPLDIQTDLCTLLEQLPDALAALESNTEFSIDFYEQGSERFLSFEPSGDTYLARCTSSTDWTPQPEVELIDRLALQTMLVALREDVMRFLSRRAPALAAHPWMREWAGGPPG